MNRDSTRSTATEVLFILLGLLGLAGTWAQAFGYLDMGLLAGNVQFWKEAVATPAGTFITVDILVLGAALFVWMFGDGRRLGIQPGWLWAYFLGSLFVGISFAVPRGTPARNDLQRGLLGDDRGRRAGGRQGRGVSRYRIY